MIVDVLSEACDDINHMVCDYPNEAVDVVTGLMDSLRCYLDAVPPFKLSDEHEGLLEGLRRAIGKVDLIEVNAARYRLQQCIDTLRIMNKKAAA